VVRINPQFKASLRRRYDWSNPL